MRYFARLAYNGKNYNGWQIQKNKNSTVQQVVEDALFTISREEIRITGCGRTDSGVHASTYYIHFDSNYGWEDKVYKLNRVLPDDLVFFKIVEVGIDDHARFDAITRSYTYYLHTYKDVFCSDLSYFYRTKKVDLSAMNEVAGKLLEYDEFFPFCKSNSGVDHYKCTILNANWIQVDTTHFEFHITANRFLRGMVRLITGACMLVNEGKLSINDIHIALENQERLPKSLSAPPEGLFLSKIIYPERISELF